MNSNLYSFCRLYNKEKSLTDNPYNKAKDEFKWYMWRMEFVTVNHPDQPVNNEEEAEEYFKQAIKNAIDSYCSAWAGGDPSPYYNKYFS